MTSEDWEVYKMGVDNVRQGIIIMFSCILISVILAFIGGFVIDSVYQYLFDGGWFADIDSDWDSSGLLNTMINLYYLFCALVGLTGVAAFVLSLFNREAVDTIYGY